MVRISSPSLIIIVLPGNFEKSTDISRLVFPWEEATVTVFSCAVMRVPSCISARICGFLLLRFILGLICHGFVAIFFPARLVVQCGDGNHFLAFVDTEYGDA